MLDRIGRLDLLAVLLYVALAALLYTVNQELHMWEIFLAIPIAALLECRSYDKGLEDGVAVIMSSMTHLEQTELAEKLTVIEKELNDQL